MLLTTIDNVEITRENARIYFSQKQWDDLLHIMNEKGYHDADRLRFAQYIGNISHEVRLLAEHNSPEYVCQFIGGSMNGIIPLKKAEQLTDRRSGDLSTERARGALVHRRELDNKPQFGEYCGPMWDGIRNNGTVVLRYETWDIYNSYD